MIATLNNDTKKSRDEKYSTMRPSMMKSGSKTTMNDDVFESKISSSRKGNLILCLLLPPYYFYLFSSIPKFSLNSIHLSKSN